MVERHLPLLASLELFCIPGQRFKLDKQVIAPTVGHKHVDLIIRGAGLGQRKSAGGIDSPIFDEARHHARVKGDIPKAASRSAIKIIRNPHEITGKKRRVQGLI
jgi:hypothetical protein